MTTAIDTIPDAPRALKRVEGADDASLDGRHRYAKAIATAGDIVPKGLWSPVRRKDGTMGPPEPSAGKILVVTEVARMLGFHPLAGIMSVHIIEGKPTISPAMMSAKVRTEGHRLRVGTTGSLETRDLTGWAVLIRADDPEFEYRVEWSLADAVQAGLGKWNGTKWDPTKDNWRKYPRSMLKARAIAEVCREGAEDALMGAAYIPDELGAETNEDGEALQDQPARRPERDWVADIDAADNIDVLAEIREALRISPDYTPGLWNHLVTRAGAFMAAEEEAVEGELEPDETPDGQDRTSEDEIVTPEDESAAESDTDRAESDTAAGVDDPEWTGEPCPACGANHDPSVHDGDDEEAGA